MEVTITFEWGHCAYQVTAEVDPESNSKVQIDDVCEVIGHGLEKDFCCVEMDEFANLIGDKGRKELDKQLLDEWNEQVELGTLGYDEFDHGGGEEDG